MPELDLLAVAEDGEAAFKLVQLHHPDVAVLDVEMPKANGPQDRRRRPGHPRALPRNGCSTIFCSTANAINATGGNPGGELTQSYSTLVGIAGLATGTTQATSSSFAWTADEPADLHVTSTARPTSRRCCRWAARPRRCSSSWTSPPARPARSRRTPSPPARPSRAST